MLQLPRPGDGVNYLRSNALRFLVVGILSISSFGSVRADISATDALVIARQVLVKSGVTEDVSALSLQSVEEHGPVIEYTGPPDDTRKSFRKDPSQRAFAFECTEGKERALQVRIGISVTTGQVIDFRRSRYLLSIGNRPDSYTEEMCRVKAIAWLRLVKSYLPLAPYLFQHYSPREHIMTFEWHGQRKIGVDYNVIIPPYVSVDINRQTGQICNLTTYMFPIGGTIPVPSIDLQRAMPIATHVIGEWAQDDMKAKDVGTFAGAVLRLFLVPAYPGHPMQRRLMWELNFAHGRALEKGIENDDAVLVDASWQVDIDAQDGVPLSCKGDFKLLENNSVPSISNLSPNCEDFEPTWFGTDDSLLVFTLRKFEGEIDPAPDITEQPLPVANPSHGPPGNRIMVVSPHGETSGLLAASVLMRRPAVNAAKARVAFGVRGEVYVLDVKSGQLGRCNDGLRVYRSLPAWSPDGTLLATTGTHSPADKESGESDPDIFVSGITDKLGPVSVDRQYCLVNLPGEDKLAAFSPDGRRVAFLHRDPFAENESIAAPKWSIYLVDADSAAGNPNYRRPEVVVDGLKEPNEMSWFPDGRRLLLGFDTSEVPTDPLIVDIVVKKVSFLKLPVLHDPDFPLGYPLCADEISLDPGGRKIAFAALRWSGKVGDIVTRCIYTCDLDGRHLLRRTEPQERPIVVRHYTEPGVTVFNALRLLEKRASSGAEWSPEYQKKFIEHLDAVGHDLRLRAAARSSHKSQGATPVAEIKSLPVSP